MPDGFFDIPAGCSDADILQSELERLGNKQAALRRKGICAHGWRQGYTPTHRPDLKPGQTQCLDCGEVSTDATLDEERATVLPQGGER